LAVLRSGCCGTVSREFRGVQKVFGLVFSPDGQTLVSGSIDGTVRLWNVATGEERGRLERPANANAHAITWPVAVFPDNRTSATQDLDHRLRLWDAATGKELRQLNRLPQPLSGAAVAPDGAVVATADENPPTIRLWQVASGQELRQLHGHQGSVEHLAFAADGQLLAAGDVDGMSRFWEVATGTERRQIRAAQVGFSAWRLHPTAACWRRVTTPRSAFGRSPPAPNCTPSLDTGAESWRSPSGPIPKAWSRSGCVAPFVSGTRARAGHSAPGERPNENPGRPRLFRLTAGCWFMDVDIAGLRDPLTEPLKS
jgi:WD40 repeat protein